MKRDLDLIRKLILAVEDVPTGTAPEAIEIEGYTAEQVGYHSYLIVDSGLAEGADIGGFQDSSPNWCLNHLTSAGHDFADAAHSESLWTEAKKIVKERAGGTSLDILKEVLTAVVRGAVGLS